VSIIAAKALIGRESDAELSQAVQHLTGARQALNPQNVIVADQFDLVTFR
jgi:nickel-dependent lactate racemase